jgi:TRAP-type transport system large permease protein
VLWIFLGVLFAAILLGVPVSFALGLAAVVLMFLMDVGPAIVVEQAIRGVNSFPLLAIPFFILAGEIMSRGGIARRLVAFAQALVGFIAGGLGLVNVAASMLFGGICGSAVADTSAIGGMMIPAMKEQGYTGGHATSITVSSAVIGIIIPPSIPMILFGIVTETSITRLFIGGLIPGLVIGVALMITTFITAKRHHAGLTQKFSLRELGRSLRGAALGLLLPVIIVTSVLFTLAMTIFAVGIHRLIIRGEQPGWVVFRFGRYELDTRLYELRQSGVPVRVEPQVFDVLAYLLATL